MVKILAKLGDITKFDTDAIVNAANSYLRPGAGVDGAIRATAGDKLNKECEELIDKIDYLEPGNAVYTSGGNLKARFVIHTVGPIWQGGINNESEILRLCYINCLKIATGLEISSIAFPSISTGIYGYPKQQAAEIAVESVKNFDFKGSSINTVVFVCFDNDIFQIYNELLTSLKF